MRQTFQHDKLLERAMAAFETATGMRAQYANVVTNTAQSAPLVDVFMDRQPIRFAAQVTALERFQTVGMLGAKTGTSLYPVLLVAPYVTEALAAHCRALRQPFIDEAGNAYIEAPGLFVYVTGKRRPVPAMTTPNFRSLTPAGLRIIFALLHQPALLAAPYRDIAKAAKLALGSVGDVLADLERRARLTSEQTGPRRFLDRAKLEDEWVTHYPIKLRPKLQARRFTSTAPDWWRSLDMTQFQASWSGEAAALMMTDYLKPARLTLYVDDTPDQLIMAARLRPDAQGEIEILQSFWDTKSAPPVAQCAPPLLVYADLMASDDPRNIEAAHLIRERFLA